MPLQPALTKAQGLGSCELGTICCRFACVLPVLMRSSVLSRLGLGVYTASIVVEVYHTVVVDRFG